MTDPLTDFVTIVVNIGGVLLTLGASWGHLMDNRNFQGFFTALSILLTGLAVTLAAVLILTTGMDQFLLTARGFAILFCLAAAPLMGLSAIGAVVDRLRVPRHGA